MYHSDGANWRYVPTSFQDLLTILGNAIVPKSEKYGNPTYHLSILGSKILFAWITYNVPIIQA